MISDINSEDRLVQKTFADQLHDVLQRIPAWTQNSQTQAEVKVLVLDTLWQSLPRLPFTERDTEELANRVYDYVWQRSTIGNFPEERVAT